jgi:hypothetical protein
LFVDNCPAHPKVEGLSSIRLVFFPPNTTSKLQPCDQGIIKILKTKYRQQLISKYLECVEINKTVEINVLSAINFIHLSWREVTSKCIQNCFSKSGFKDSILDSDMTEYDSDDDIIFGREMGEDEKRTAGN